MHESECREGQNFIVLAALAVGRAQGSCSVERKSSSFFSQLVEWFAATPQFKQSLVRVLSLAGVLLAFVDAVDARARKWMCSTRSGRLGRWRACQNSLVGAARAADRAVAGSRQLSLTPSRTSTSTLTPTRTSNPNSDYDPNSNPNLKAQTQALTLTNAATNSLGTTQDARARSSHERGR